MQIKERSINRIFNITCLLILAVLSLAACGSFAVQGQTQPNGDSGITITGDTEVIPQESNQSDSPAIAGSATLILLILVGVGVFILVLLLVIGRSKGQTHA